jgi:hypothetical protein
MHSSCRHVYTFFSFFFAVNSPTLLHPPYPLLSYPLLFLPFSSSPLLSSSPLFTFLILSYPLVFFLFLSYTILSSPLLPFPLISSHILSSPPHSLLGESSSLRGCLSPSPSQGLSQTPPLHRGPGQRTL